MSKTPKIRDIGAMFKVASEKTPSPKQLLEQLAPRQNCISPSSATDADIALRSHIDKVRTNPLQSISAKTCVETGVCSIDIQSLDGMQVAKKRRDACIVYQKKVAKRITRRSPTEEAAAQVDGSANINWEKGDDDGIQAPH